MPRFINEEWQRIGASMIIIALILGYITYYVTTAPIEPFSINPEGVVISACPYIECDVDDYPIAEGDIIHSIETRPIEEFLRDRSIVTFDDIDQDGKILVVYERDDQMAETYLPIISDGNSVRLIRAMSIMVILPFWVAGTLVLLFLRPRDSVYRLATSFFYVTALWITAGLISESRIFDASLINHAIAWLMLPIYTHFHWVIANREKQDSVPKPILLLYGLASILAIGEAVQLLPPRLFLFGPLFAVLLGIGQLIYWYFTKRAYRNVTRIMLLGVGLGFGLGLISIIIPFTGPAAPILNSFLPIFLMPLLPAFYTYALAQSRLGEHEFRINRLLSYYTFGALVLFVAVAWIGLGGLLFDNDPLAIFYAISIFFALAVSPMIFSRFEKTFSRIAYGSAHNPQAVLNRVADHIPTIGDASGFVSIFTKDILPTLLIKESAMLIMQDGAVNEVFRLSLPSHAREQFSTIDIQNLILEGGKYRHPLDVKNQVHDWVRLAIPLELNGRELGVWLFGRRDPDDFYPEADIKLLQALANQIVPTIENSNLYSALQEYATGLEAEVVKRTTELESEKTRMEAILSGAGEGIFFANVEGRVLFANPTLGRMLSTDEKLLLNHQFLEWLEPDNRKGIRPIRKEQFDRNINAVITQQRRDTLNVICQKKSGDWFHAILTLSPVLVSNGSQPGVVGILTDITTQRKLDEMKDSFVSTVTHELRNPLTNILNYVHLMHIGHDDKREAYKEVVDREIFRLNTLISDLLELSRLEATNTSQTRKSISLGGLVHHVFEAFKIKAEQRDIILHCIEDDDAKPALADPKQIEIVLTNLIGNAINYSPVGSVVTVTIATQFTRDGNLAVVTVSDNGDGIPEKDLKHLFERFYRGATGRNSDSPGSGLGLAISKEIVEGHFGNLTVESTVGQGTSFTMTLPVANETDQA